MNSPKSLTISYTYLIGDLFHYGHLKLLQLAKQKADIHICGVIADEAAVQWEPVLVSNYEERSSVIRELSCVDEVIEQASMDPTENLRALHQKYPEAKLILLQGHQKWEQMPGVMFIKSIGGEIIRPEYYPRLSRDNIANAFLNPKESIGQSSVSRTMRLGDVSPFQAKEEISTKANTLQRLKPQLKESYIENLFVFTVKQWKSNQYSIVEQIQADFQEKTIVVRSSSLKEDLEEFSNAGHYSSFLNIQPHNTKQLIESIQHIIEDYQVKDGEVDDYQVLVQKQTEEVQCSGVVFTRNPRRNTPYYLINYDESRATDTVTAGLVGTKVEILRTATTEETPMQWQQLIVAVKELEEIFSGMVLDIEFAITQTGEVIVFQVRPLAASRKYLATHDASVIAKVSQFRQRIQQIAKQSQILPAKVFLSDMAFWNPAEIIGDSPNFLDYSLYNTLILKSAWNTALQPLGYTAIEDGLMVLLGNKPYINVHYSFLTLTPESVPAQLKTKLLNFYNCKLQQQPHLHDKIEFDIAYNCYDFELDRKAKELQDAGFSLEEVAILKKSLFNVTNDILENYESIIEEDLLKIRALSARREGVMATFRSEGETFRASIKAIRSLLEDCISFGTIPFSRMARLGFMGKILLTGLKKMDQTIEASADAFFSSITTVATQLDNAFNNLSEGKGSVASFLKNYGHLRPGTYDITQLPYAKNPNYFHQKILSTVDTSVLASVDHSAVFSEADRPADLVAVAEEIAKQHDLKCSGEELLVFVDKATQMREYFKFEFTKNLSAALELIARIGEEFGCSREDMSHLDIDLILFAESTELSKAAVKNIWQSVISSRKQDKKENAYVSLAPIIYSEKDLVAVPTYTTAPNFITEKNSLLETVALDQFNSDQLPDITDKLVVIEKADPGYDWIFTHKIGGLITKYGGAASHMAIRCAEFDIPAAIGCGEQLFAKAVACKKAYLDCKAKKINFV